MSHLDKHTQYTLMKNADDNHRVSAIKKGLIDDTEVHQQLVHMYRSEPVNQAFAQSRINLHPHLENNLAYQSGSTKVRDMIDRTSLSDFAKK